MNINDKLVLLAIGVFALTSAPAGAQDSADDAADVILIIEEQWQAEEDGDNEWLDEMLVDNFSSWEKSAPAPRSKSSTKKWDRFSDDQGETLEHELYFQNIVVHDDVAIAHYLYTIAYQDKDKKVEVTNGRYTDILVRTEDGWRFISWHGGDDE